MIIEDRRMSREAGPKFREVRRPAKQRPETKEHIREEGGEREGAAQEREVERWAVKDGMDDLGAREQFPSGPESRVEQQSERLVLSYIFQPHFQIMLT